MSGAAKRGASHFLSDGERARNLMASRPRKSMDERGGIHVWLVQIRTFLPFVAFPSAQPFTNAHFHGKTARDDERA